MNIPEVFQRSPRYTKKKRKIKKRKIKKVRKKKNK